MGTGKSQFLSAATPAADDAAPLSAQSSAPSPSGAMPVPAAVPLAAQALRPERIRAALQSSLSPTEIELTDESHLHAGHAGAREGKGHFRLRIVSQRFAGLRSIGRHRLVYQSLADLMLSDIHALNITALTPDEVRRGTAGFSQPS